MPESIGKVITEVAGIQVEPAKIHRFDRAVERKIGQALDEADARARRHAIEKIPEMFQRPPQSEEARALHEQVMASNVKPKGIMSFEEFRQSRGL